MNRIEAGPGTPEAEKAPTGHFPINPAWLAQRNEEIIEPDLPIVDSHHHLWGAHGLGAEPYLLEGLVADTDTGHRVVATVYVETKTMHRADGPEELRTVGEIEFANGIAAMSASGNYGPMRACAGIVGYADLASGRRVGETLDAMCAVTKRLRGIRVVTTWDDEVRPAWSRFRPGMLAEPGFREGFAELAPRGLTFDTAVYFRQLPEVLALARQFPGTPIIINHFGGLLGIGPYIGRHDEVFAIWSSSIRDLARCDNVHVKLGGVGMPIRGHGWEQRPLPPSSAEMAAVWKPYVETCVEAFGAHRAAFESNFPVDKSAISYPVLWNAFKRMAAGCSATEKADLFSGTAIRFYGLALPQ